MTIHRWTFDDGTTLETGGAVTGTGKAAAHLREALAGGYMFLAPHPTVSVAIDRGSNFQLHFLALQAGGQEGVGFTTGYEFSEADAPTVEIAELRARALAFAADPEEHPDRIY